ncbi:aminotransferase class V-fold PLP-dependent enzyme [Pigmentiphaga kullae]|uniref:Cysteine desulfurase/selenocysteine lyase n=1 Tax=Pigmentiphaga kullae TaxID=151784 RepID=A0A4Q7NM40_9BURK|nr:aminotransferase class V-fold PLP-dependent enzyme [Pigmentiphaga kullae]RZS85620.1 cysteine desulfurase/selenocysteine lyase [Pigmentiphaga kullae]
MTTVTDMSPFAALRARFPGTARRAHLDVASRSLIPASSLDIAQAHLLERVNGVIDKDRYFGLVETVRQSFARLVNADPIEIAMTKNVSEGLNIVAASIDWRPGDEVILCSDIEHPNNLYTWRNQERLGVVVRDLPSPDGLFPLQAALDRLGEGSRVRVVTVSATSFKPGLRTDLHALGRACRAAGAHLVVDAAQAAGITHLDVEAMGIDALAASTQKGLCSLYGMGLLYVRRAFAESLTPPYLARFGVTIAATHEADYDKGPIHYKAGAQRFDVGNYNFLASALVADTLSMLLACGTPAIDRHVTALATSLADGLTERGCGVVRPAGAIMANMVCLRIPGGGPASAELQRHLQEHRVQAAVRRDLLRFSIHAYNDRSDIDRAVAVTAQWHERQSRV